jgi:hypothetical protein
VFVLNCSSSKYVKILNKAYYKVKLCKLINIMKIIFYISEICWKPTTFIVMFFLLFFNTSISVKGQNKLTNDNIGILYKESKIRLATIQNPDLIIPTKPYGTSKATITSKATGGNWGTNGTWVGGIVPSATDNVVIDGPVSVNGLTRTCANLTINAGKTLTINASITLNVTGNINNSGTLSMTAGTSITSTWLAMGGNVTNNVGATINASASYIRFIFSSANAQTFTNNGTLTSPLYSFDVSNTNASGLTLAGSNGFVVTRANLFTGTVVNSNKITLGSGGATYVTVQRGVAANTSPAGRFDVSPSFNVGTGGLSLLYDNGSVSYNTGFEVPGTLTTDAFYVFDAVDVTLNSNITVANELNFYGGTGTPTLRIGANTLTIGGSITYTVAGAFYGGVTSNLVMNGATTVNAISNGLNNFTINANTSLGGAITVNGTLSLTNGLLINGTNLTMASGTTIFRSSGSLYTAPNFAGTVNLTYSGGSPMNTGKELSTSSSVVNNLTTNAGGITQYAYTTSTTNLLTENFPDLANWNGNIGAGEGFFNSNVSANAGGTSREVRFTGDVASPFTPSNTTFYIKKTAAVNTTGYSYVNISFKTMSSGSYIPAVTTYLKLQSSTSSTGPWNDVWSVVYSALPAQTISIPNYTTNVGSNMYFQFAFVGDYDATDYWYFDNFVVDGVTITPTVLTATINGNLNLTAGTFTIGAGNSLVLNGTVSGSSAINGSSTSNLTVSGGGANLILPTVNNGLNNFTLNRINGVTLGNTTTLTVKGTLLMSSGSLDLKNSIIDLSSTGILSGETESNRIKSTDGFGIEGFGTGTLRATRVDPSGNVAGLGLDISPSAKANLGSTVIIRGHQKQQGCGSYSGNYSIYRYFEIQPTVQSDITINKFNYFDSELGSQAANESNLQVFQWVYTGWWMARTTTGSSTVTNYVASTTIANSLSTYKITLGSTTSPLPIELLSFTAENRSGDVLLKWETNSETNNEYFTIEKSYDANSFSVVTTEKGTGNSHSLLQYSVIDKEPYNGISYYRLRQTDFDGKFTLSNLVSINIAKSDNSLSFEVFPNPISKEENPSISISSFEPQTEVFVVMRNLIGQELFSKVVKTDFSGNAITAIDLENNLPAGTYLIIGTSLNQTLNKYLIIK